MQFPPPGNTTATGAFDSCAGVVASPVPTPVQRAAWALWALVLLTFVGNAALWRVHSDVPHMLVRSFWVVRFYDGAVVAWSCAVFLRFAVVDAQGRSTQPCLATVALYLGSLAMIASAYLTRLFHAVAQSRRSRLVRAIVPHLDDGESASVASSGKSSAPPSPRGAARWLTDRLGFALDTLFALPTSKVEGASTTRDAQQRALARATDATRPRALVFMAAFVTVPFVLPLAVLATTVDAYAVGCTGCPLYWPLIIAWMCTLAPYALLGLRLQILLLGEHDDFGVNAELFASLLGAILWSSVGLALIVTDPGGVDASNAFEYEWLLFLSAYGAMLLYTPCQVLVGLRHERGAARRAASLREARASRDEAVLGILNTDAMMRSLNNERFLDHAERTFTIENVRFLQDVQTWRAYFYDKPASWRRAKLRVIVDLYVRTGAPMEINISEHARRSLVERSRAAASGTGDAALSPDVFVDAEREVGNMLVQGVWRDFVVSSEGVVPEVGVPGAGAGAGAGAVRSSSSP